MAISFTRETTAMTTKKWLALGFVAVAGPTVLGGCVYRTETVPAPAASPTTVVVSPPTSRVYTFPEGRYELRGDGTPTSPYVWVWIPTGANPPNPPPLPR
jgi:hypothetical protein